MIAVEMPPSVNFHFWQPCNMSCRYCFATFEDVLARVPKGHLGRGETLELTGELSARFEKITFVGGEPTLCPWLPELLAEAKKEGATTMIVSNGSRLDDGMLNQLAEHLDWLTLSVDSASAYTHRVLGRVVGTADVPYVAIADGARRLGIRLKLNTVVSRANVSEDLSELVAQIAPERWKVFQVLPVAGQNDGDVDQLLVSAEELDAFARRHEALEALGVRVVVEDNEAMTGSYAMVDPSGRFFDNATGRHRYSSPILEVGVNPAWSEIAFNPQKFEGRGGRYDWR